MPFDLILFGVNLVPFIAGVIALLRNETEISDYILDWVGAFLYAVAAVFCLKEVQDQLALLPNVLFWFKIATTFIGVLLTFKGYWPDARAGLSKARGVVAEALAPARHRFFGKY